MDQKQDATQTPPADQPATTDNAAQAGIPAPSAPETPAATETPAAPEAPTASQTSTPEASAAPMQTPASPAGSNTAKIISSEPAPKGRSKSAYVVVGIALLVIVLGGAYLFFFKHSTPTKIAQNTVTPSAAVSPTPSETPVTASNVDQTLNNADATMQQSSSQATADLNSVSSIDSTQDSTTGL